MSPVQIARVRPGTTIWVWVVRFGRGRWWPGTVESLQTHDSLPLLTVKFECSRRPTKERPVMTGIVSTRMRYLELRDPTLKGADRPEFTPSSVLHAPETNAEAMTRYGD
jgi:hypothetical protein